VFDGNLGSLAPPLTLPAPGTAPALNMAPWHADDPCPVINAVLAANQAAPHLEGLARFILPRLTAWQLASSTIKGEGEPFSTYVSLEQAMGHQWWSPNTRAWCNVLIIDADQPGWRPRLDRLVALGLRRPAYTVASPWKGSAHLVWVLDQPLQNSDPGETRLKAGIRRGLNAELGGDPRFTHRLTKNPWHGSETPVEPTPDIPCGDPELWAAYTAAGHQLTYHTEVGDLRTVTANELLDPLLALADERDEWLLSPRPRWNPSGATWTPPAVKIPGVKEGQDPARALFGACADAVRRACTGRREVIRGIIDRTAGAWGFAVSEPSRVEMAGSISSWMNTKWRGPLDGKPGADRAVGRRQVDVGVMKGEAADAGPEALAEWCALTWTERRQAAGRRSASMVQDGHRHALSQARADLVAEGVRPTQAAVAARAGVSLKTAKRHWHHLAERPVAQSAEGVTRSNLSCGGLTEVSTSAQPPLPGIETSSLLAADEPAVAAYEASAARMKQRGADPEAVLPPPPGSSPALQAAYRSALAARVGAQRRLDARRAKATAATRAADREAWHAGHVGDEEAWQARLEDISHHECVSVERVLQAGGHPAALDRIEMAFQSIRGAEHRARRRALGEVPPARRRAQPIRPRGPDQLDLAIPY
jgi:hypothetical protein